MKKLIYHILLLLLICLLFSSCSVKEENEQLEAVFEVSAETLWSNFKHDRDAAESTYKNKQVIVTGEIAEPPTIFMQHLCILLENGENSIPDGIFCMFPEDYDARPYNVGDTISVCGKCTLGIHIAGDDSNPYIYIENAHVQETVVN